MITYSKKGLRVAEAYYDEPAIQSGADVLRCLNYAQPIHGGNSQAFHTIHIDLCRTPEEIFAEMNSTTRNDSRRAEREGVTCEAQSQPGDAWLNEFFAFFEEFAAAKGLPSPNRDRITGMRDAGILDLSRALDADGNVLVWHCQYGAQARIRLLHSASLFRHTEDKERIRLISRANRFLHYRDMVRFRESGFAIYDFGGWYAGQDDEEKLRINKFKESFGGQVVRVFNSDRGLTMKGVLAVYARQALDRLRGQE
ncbi:hypothetical protein [Paludibaculum fermentans]|uniref:hypothetical protein n=1 Tax=Paludibaculum fermentans TaxID=1473598 RepID=UPI003EBCB975